jgi:hypothetical protein
MRTLLFLVAIGASAGAAPVHAQLPQRFENLKVIPADLPRDSVISIMRNFSFALGVRCVYCHVGEDSPTLANVDFKSDEKQTKRTAREMLRMVANINQTLATLPDRGPASLQVRCATCHRGVRRPVPLEDTLYTVLSNRGGTAAAAVYDSLRTAYNGRAAFDFGSQTLVRLSEKLFTANKHEEAIPILLRNAEVYPRFWGTFYELGRHYEAVSRKAEAIAAYRATLERLPGHEPSLARLRALGVGG